MDNPLSRQDRSRTKWTESLDKVFVDLALEQVLQGNWSDNAFNKAGWKYIRDEFIKQTGLEFNRKQLKKHLDVLRNRYLNMKSQLEQKSFGREDSRYMMNGDDILEFYIEVDPVSDTIRSKDYPIYDQLCKIFAQTVSIGKYAQSSHYIDLDQQALASETPQSLSCQKPTNVLLGDSPSRSGMGANLDTLKKRKPLTPSSSRPYKRNHTEFDDSLAEAMLEMVTASKLRAEVMIQYSDKFSIKNCIQLLDEMPALDEDIYLAALDLFDNPNLREMFVSLKSSRRSTWLQGKCGIVAAVAPSAFIV
ncbi:hypothetical protein GIB67_003913 [Kingdonia uniflora]|uniref:Myb/SANT-like domain-containing protein n=1 Tax=Kingdonia uniflora TaxID=39325 RepID=A0A7J7LJZ8_9MAGN|nr:hypothetical protein GIB67_003913 [Kingdonia uniflora]